MAGVNWLKKGCHWSRQGSKATTPAEVNARLIGMLCRLPDKEITNKSSLEDKIRRDTELQVMRLKLLKAVAIARHDQQEARRRQTNKTDCKRQLQAMLKLDDASLAKAIEDCDTYTRAAISAAQNAIWLTPEAKWVSSEEMPGMQILAPETVRRSVEIALANARSSVSKRGRKEKPYQQDLARACLRYWSACQPQGASGRVEFTRAVFEAAESRNDNREPGNAPENSKNLERLLSEAARKA
ncbi:hypothetical protein ACVA51_13065 [Pseudomonas luteola]